MAAMARLPAASTVSATKASLSLRRYLSRSLSPPRRFPATVPRARRGVSSSASPLVFASEEDLSFVPPLRIVEYPDPILRAPNKLINVFNEKLKMLADEMFDVMYKTDGIGLSAPQVGVNVHLMVFNPAGERGKGEEMVLVNPFVVKASSKMLIYEEGCLSFPGIYADVERPATIKVNARDLTGQKFKVSLSGLSARVFQHEFDHLQGTLFFDRMADHVLDEIRPELKNLEEKYESLTGHKSPEKIDNYTSRSKLAGFRREAVGFSGKDL